MKKFHIVFMLAISSSITFSQNINDVSKYYDLGNQALARRQYSLADSLYSIALKNGIYADIYFNRALARKKLMNIEGYCQDIQNAANLKDSVANRLYWKNCVDIDSVYYDISHQACEKENYSFKEVKIRSKFSNDEKYTLYNAADQILVKFEVISNDTLFTASTSPPKYPEEENAIIENVRYIVPFDALTHKNNTPGLNTQGKIHVFLSFTILQNGEMTDYKISSIGFNKKYEDEILTVFKKYTKNWTPAQYNGLPVKYRKLLGWSV